MVEVFTKQLQAGVLVVLLALGAVAATAQSPVAPFDACRSQIDADPKNPVVYYCVYRAVLAHGHADEAVALLRRRFRENPSVYRIEMFIAWIDRMRERAGWEKTLQESVDGMERTGDAYGVVYGGLMLASRFGELGDFRQARTLLRRCQEAAQRTGDPSMRGRVLVGRGIIASRQGDYSGWLHSIREAEKLVFPDGPYDIRSTVLNQLGAAYWYLCQYREAYGAFARAAAIREGGEDDWSEAIELYNMALCGFGRVEQGEMPGEELGGLLERGYRLAVRSGNGGVEAGMELLMGRQSAGTEALRHALQALKIARLSGAVDTEIEALTLMAVNLANRGPHFENRSGEYFRQAKRLARETSHRFILAKILASEARVRMVHGSRQAGVGAHLKVLDFIEGLRAPQVGGLVRAQSFSRWGFVYYRLAGFLLQGSSASPEPERDRALAFQTMERFRARELLESLHAPRRVSSAMAASEPYRKHREVVRQISDIQRRLADPKLGPKSRQAALFQLGELEEDESRLRDELERRFTETGRPLHTGIPGLREVQTLLAPDQALLTFQLWDGEPGTRPAVSIGKSWLLVITRGCVRSVALPARRDLRAQLGVLEGLLQPGSRNENLESSAASRLGRELLGEALAGLPRGVRRLVLVPDDALARCPFAMLTPGGSGAVLGSRFEISLVPSVAVWVTLKRRERLAGPRPSRGSALILCSPFARSELHGEADLRAAGPWRNGLHLARLPHAAEEARALWRVAGSGSQLLVGAEASEAALKGMKLDRFEILDLVTHSVVDDEQPERSAIILAPGSATEDGFLQVREIPELGLDGQLVILSSCSSSSGRILGGEGVQSLARAFLEAGAGAVLASLWPLQDEQAASLFGELSRQMGQGHTVAEALRLAQRRARDVGMPAGAWAGVVVLGDGDLRPLPGRSSWVALGLLLGIAVVILAGVLLVKRTR